MSAQAAILINGLAACADIPFLIHPQPPEESPLVGIEPRRGTNGMERTDKRVNTHTAKGRYGEMIGVLLMLPAKRFVRRL
jgi:hypothetical protein